MFLAVADIVDHKFWPPRQSQFCTYTALAVMP